MSCIFFSSKFAFQRETEAYYVLTLSNSDVWNDAKMMILSKKAF